MLKLNNTVFKAQISIVLLLPIQSQNVFSQSRHERKGGKYIHHIYDISSNNITQVKPRNNLKTKCFWFQKIWFLHRNIPTCLFQVNYFLILQFFKTRQKQPKEELRMYLYWSFPVGTGGKKQSQNSCNQIVLDVYLSSFMEKILAQKI